MQKQIDPAIKEQFLSLPKKVQDLITLSGWQYKIRDIVKRTGLRTDQGAEIESEVFLVMLGLSEPEDFLANIMNVAQLDPVSAQKIIDAVSSQIFAPLKHALIDITETKEEETVIQPEGERNVIENIVSPAVVAPSVPENKAENTSETREEILSQIENPIKTETQVLSKDIVSAPKISAPIAPTPIPNPIKKIDPYRELI